MLSISLVRRDSLVAEEVLIASRVSCLVKSLLFYRESLVLSRGSCAIESPFLYLESLCSVESPSLH